MLLASTVAAPFAEQGPLDYTALHRKRGCA
ncbi:MAG: hypothetical protein JWM91_360 [Rhodospirillales bacterium]|nr:hypothetical protein [Rhodospirillales bacterium]